MKRFNFILVALALGSAGAQQTCGPTQILRDPGFDLWCGDHLCAWKVERGDIARVPTWNEADPAVQLIGSDAAIEQLSGVTDFDVSCMEFKMIANVDLNAHVALNIDLNGDGTIEQTIQIPTAAWQPLRFLIAVGPPFSGIRFELAKTGDGTAVLADIEAQTSTDCGGMTPIVSQPVPIGAPCRHEADCASGICGHSTLPSPFTDPTLGVCEGCSTGTCTGSDVCGAGDPVGPNRAVPDECVAPASKVLGEACELDVECETGVCTDNACSTCGAGHPCASETCGPAWVGPHATLVCSPHGMKRLTGEPCATDDDCASSSCAGTPAKRCEDGRTCGNDIDCPFVDNGGPTTVNGTCTVVGVDGGTCT